MKTTAEYAFTATEPDEIIFTATIKMSLGSWRRVREALVSDMSSDLANFRGNIRDLIDKAETQHCITEAE